MENENIPQPLDALMQKLGVVNADLVKASTEQLSFKMVQKARKGRRLNPRIQEKILTALLAVKPELKLKRKDLFCYDLGLASVEAINGAEPTVIVQGPPMVNLEKKAEKIGKLNRKKKAVMFKKSGKFGKMILKHRVKKSFRHR